MLFQRFVFPAILLVSQSLEQKQLALTLQAQRQAASFLLGVILSQRFVFLAILLVSQS